ncbi:MAG TPA: DoxX family protein, partial [Opitutaceae bacterium]|nr:DoxX family protein [Opitutaceae bacterium]
LTNVGKTADFFTSLHIPFPVANVYISGTTELVGGILLMLGLFSRLISVPLLFNFCVAYLTASQGAVKELLHFKNPDDFINDSAFPFLVTSLLILAFGPGKISLDYLLEKLCGKKSGASAKDSKA